MEHLSTLNERQREAVLHTDGPLLIVAGAGAGKTKTITHRIAHLIEIGVPAHAILAVTFTNKAAGEMRERIEQLLRHMPYSGETKRGMPLVATFHALGVRLLREFSEEAGLPRSFVIWDRDDSVRAVKAALKDIGAENQYTPRQVLGALSRRKGDGLRQEEYAAEARYPFEKTVAEVWRRYEAALRAEHAVDFDDLLTRTLTVLKENPRVRAQLNARWRYITIDEYQDTNRAQYEIARILAGEAKNICVVGDTDQNIYSWRGAELEHLLAFEETFPGTKAVTLEQNYRSTQIILEAANAVIQKNVRRKDKRLFTETAGGELITMYTAPDEAQEARFVVQKAAALIANGTKPSSIAVLYRENFLSRALEEAFLGAGIPYRVLGVRFFERKEVKDLLSFIRFAANPESRADLARIVGITPGIGPAALVKMTEGRDAELGAAARGKVSALRERIARIAQATKERKASEVVLFAIKESGMDMLYRGGGEEGSERLENMQELAAFAARYDELPVGEGIERLLEDAALASEQDSLEKKLEAVSLMTIHASKGLEFDAVFIVGLEQGLFPSTRESDEDRDSEEERRLFYVALTRARRHLFLTNAASRIRYGQREYTIPSEFLDDIDQKLVLEHEEKGPSAGARGRGGKGGGILDWYEEQEIRY